MKNQSSIFSPYQHNRIPQQPVIYGRSSISGNEKPLIKFTVIPQNSTKPYSLSCPKTISGYNTSSSSVISSNYTRLISPKQNMQKCSQYFGINENPNRINNSPLFRSQYIEPEGNISRISSAINIKPSSIIMKYSNPPNYYQNHSNLSHSQIQCHAKIDDFFPKQNKPIQNIYRDNLKESYLSQNSIRSDKSQKSKKKIKVTLAGDIYYDRSQIKSPVRSLLEPEKKQQVFQIQNRVINHLEPVKRQNQFEIQQKHFKSPQKSQVLSNFVYYETMQRPRPSTLKRPFSQLHIMASKQRQTIRQKSKSPSQIIRFNYISSPGKISSESEKKIKLSSFHFKNPAKLKLKRKQSKQSSNRSNNSNNSNNSKDVKVNILRPAQVNDQYFPQFKIKKKKTLKKEVNRLQTNQIVDSSRRNTFIDKLQGLQKLNPVLQDYGIPHNPIAQSKYSTCSKYSGKIQHSTLRPFVRTIKLSSFGEQVAKKRQTQLQLQKSTSKISKISEYEMNSQDQSEQLSLTSRQQTNSVFSKQQSSNETHDEELAKKIKNELNLNFSYKST